MLNFHDQQELFSGFTINFSVKSKTSSGIVALKIHICDP